MELNQETIDLLDNAFRRLRHASRFDDVDPRRREAAVEYRLGAMNAICAMTGGSMETLYDEFQERLARYSEQRLRDDY